MNKRNTSEYRLTQEILKRSVSKYWYEAKHEWRIENICYVDEPETCLCGHYPIKEICTLRNIYNDVAVDVGNICVKKFMGLPSHKIFSAIKRISQDISKALNPDTIEYMYGKEWINDWEKAFYLNTYRKRILTTKQITKRIEINEIVLREVRSNLTVSETKDYL